MRDETEIVLDALTGQQVFRTMCGLGESLENRGFEKGIEKGIKQGMEQGIRQGIIVLVETLRELGQTNEMIVAQIMKKYKLTEKEAKKYIS